MSHYHDDDDRKFLSELKKLAPEEFKGFIALRAGAAVTHGALALKLFDKH